MNELSSVLSKLKIVSLLLRLLIKVEVTFSGYIMYLPSISSGLSIDNWNDFDNSVVDPTMKCHLARLPYVTEHRIQINNQYVAVFLL